MSTWNPNKALAFDDLNEAGKKIAVARLMKLLCVSEDEARRRAAEAVYIPQDVQIIRGDWAGLHTERRHMSLTFDPESKNLTSVSQLIGKIIARIVPHADPDDADETTQSWTLEFTDGDAVEVKASYDDSCVHFLDPDRDK